MTTSMTTSMTASMTRREALQLGLAALASACAPQVRPGSRVEPIRQPGRFKLAFLGDQGCGADARAVLNMIREEGANFTLHQGDFDYDDDPDAWDEQISAALGEDYPYFAVLGNHDRGADDIAIWRRYQKKITDRWARIPGLAVEGDPGYLCTLRYAGVVMVLSGVGVYDNQPAHYPGHTSQDGHAAYIRDALADAKEPWRFVSFHKNQRLMQVGRKQDGTGWGVYEEARKAGAIIATGHSHTYSRTHEMTRFGPEPEVAHRSDTITLARGRSFAFVEGLGGQSIRRADRSLVRKPWWASAHTKDNDADYSALFLDIGADGDPRRARAYCKDIRGRIIDDFQVVTAL